MPPAPYRPARYDDVGEVNQITRLFEWTDSRAAFTIKNESLYRIVEK